MGAPSLRHRFPGVLNQPTWSRFDGPAGYIEPDDVKRLLTTASRLAGG